MEQRHIAGYDVALTIPVVDQYGGAVDATALQYRIVDQDGLEVVAMTAFPDFVASSSEIALTTTALQNTLTTGNLREMRSVELYMTTLEGTVLGVFDYFIEAAALLVDGVNSFQNYNQAQMVAKDVAKIPGWDMADRDQRISALRQAAENMLRLTYQNYYDTLQGDPGVDTTRLITPGCNPASLRSVLGTTTYQSLPKTFIGAMRRAQVLEANFLLGGDEVEDMRRSGVMSNTVGESSQFFGTLKPLELPICRRALQEIGRFVSYAPRVSR